MSEVKATLQHLTLKPTRELFGKSLVPETMSTGVSSISEGLLDSIKIEANNREMPYQSLME